MGCTLVTSHEEVWGSPGRAWAGGGAFGGPEQKLGMLTWVYFRILASCKSWCLPACWVVVRGLGPEAPGVLVWKMGL